MRNWEHNLRAGAIQSGCIGSLCVKPGARRVVLDLDLRTEITNQSIESLALAYGWEYRRVENRGELDAALSPSVGPTIIEVPLER